MATHAEVELLRRLATAESNLKVAQQAIERITAAHNGLVAEHAKLQEQVKTFPQYIAQVRAELRQKLAVTPSFTPNPPAQWGPVLSPLIPDQPRAIPSPERARRGLPSSSPGPRPAEQVLAIEPDNINTAD